ncbi:HAD-IA family hydrolase [Erythrobacter arachoides]|uniref:Phosphoglycolate phosphatase n=1 Tax=Aurantiacibacter arachoides TaxID=1850444 RepID=A0A844ZZM6_9SPHN|nr:HAD-IA family hydrolase [Aurantiacibacter arachoides]MXO93643.1 HAD-IA family hydrolase [Aurantiacibacter arachoides]GGD47798.1 phosphoglycolate phosphatase, bacterial [Aurantiacibacter arachoides]
MQDFPFPIILFDLDGTLVDSARDLGPALNVALAAIGRPPVAESETRGMIGGGTDMMLAKALEATGGMVDAATYRRLGDTLLDHYWAHIADHTVPYPGCLAALDALLAQGCTLALVTNKAEKPARELLEALGMTDRFAAIYGGDTLGRERAKPLPDMLLAAMTDLGGARAAMVGDSTYDVRAGKAAGLPVVTCRFGYHDVPVAELGGDAMIDHFDELVGVLRALG